MIQFFAAHIKGVETIQTSVASDSTDASNIQSEPICKGGEQCYIVAQPHSSHNKRSNILENMYKFIVASLQWTCYVNVVKDPNSHELKSALFS
jgi:hypothetical protein